MNNTNAAPNSDITALSTQSAGKRRWRYCLPMPTPQALLDPESRYAWEKDSTASIEDQPPAMPAMAVSIRASINVATPVVEIAAVAQAVLQFLRASEVIADQARIVNYTAAWDRVVPADRIHVEIWETKPAIMRMGGLLHGRKWAV